jgi:UDP-glucose 4-epimerase
MVAVDRAAGYDIRDSATGAVFVGADAVVHLAGVLGTSELLATLDDAIDVNIRGTVRVLEAATEAGAHYIGISMPDVWKGSPYQATKLAGVRLAGCFHEAYRLPVTHLRTFNVYGVGQSYGPGHPQKIIPTFAARSWARLPMPVWGDGQQSVDLVHVEHVAQSLVYAATQSVGGTTSFGGCQTWDCGSGREQAVLDVARAVGEITGCGLVEFLPMRDGETPGTRLKAENFGPLFPDPTRDLFDEVVHGYRGVHEAVYGNAAVA